MDTIEEKPTSIKVPRLHASKEDKTKFMNDTIGTFVNEYVLPEFDVKKVWRLQQQQEQRNNQRGTVELFIQHSKKSGFISQSTRMKHF